jgi:hypothetical protein
MTLTGSCRLVEGVLCNEMMAEDMLVGSWTSETSSLTVDDVRMEEAVPDEPGDV